MEGIVRAHHGAGINRLLGVPFRAGSGHESTIDDLSLSEISVEDLLVGSSNENACGSWEFCRQNKL
jgi:hypothetical protein